MPNHCHNRVEFYSEDTTAILKLHSIFNKALADELLFGRLVNGGEVEIDIDDKEKIVLNIKVDEKASV